MGEIGDTALTERGRTQGVGKFLQGGVAGDTTVWVVNVGLFGVNSKEGRGDTHGVPDTDHREAIESIRRRDMGDAVGGRRTRGSGNPVGEDLHRETAGNCGAVGDSVSLILFVCKGDREQRRGA